jgi:hypothetical protein
MLAAWLSAHLGHRHDGNETQHPRDKQGARAKEPSPGYLRTMQ